MLENLIEWGTLYGLWGLLSIGGERLSTGVDNVESSCVHLRFQWTCDMCYKNSGILRWLRGLLNYSINEHYSKEYIDDYIEYVEIYGNYAILRSVGLRLSA